MGNEIYEEKNHEEYPPEVLERVNCFIRHIRNNSASRQDGVGYYADVCCGNGYIGDKFSADLYDLYPIDNRVHELDLLEKYDPFYNEYSHVAYRNVILSHALEHFHSPIKALVNVRNLLTTRGSRIHIAVPSDDIDNRHRPFDESIGHYYQFNVRNLESMGKAVGLKTVNIEKQIFKGGFYEVFATFEVI